MKVFANTIRDDFALSRIEKAFKAHSPKEIEFVDTEEVADLVIVYAFAQRRKIWWRVNKLINAGKKYAVVQTAIRSTTNPKTIDWFPIWKNAELVWSYYDLRTLIDEDGGIALDKWNFYHAPLGVDSEIFNSDIFKENPPARIWTIAIGGNRQESGREAMVASLNNFYMLGGGLSDKALATVYNQCQFVSGLRRVEGFELPVIEGLLCGAKPIVFDKPHYRKWFEGLAIFIPEGEKREVIDNLIEIFADYKNMMEVSEDQKRITRERFNWQTIISGFWKHIQYV